MHTVLEAETIGLNLIPGKKLCPTCRSKVMTCLSKSISENKNDEDFDIVNERSIQNIKESVETHFASAGVSPIKVKGLHKSGKIREGKRKLTALTTSIKKKVAISLNISEEIFEEQSSFNNEYMEKANLFDNMMVLLTNKIAESTSTSKKVQLATLAPTDWSIKKVSETLHVTNYVARTARKLTLEKGILTMPNPKLGKALPDVTVQLVKTFYEDDEHSRIMPGKKDYVSIKKNVHMQKRLLLCNLKELFVAFKTKNPEIKIGFSRFCTLRPKWCITVGASGTHSVCVCAIHQNLKLLLHPLGVTYKELLPYIVCDITNKECMMRKCEKCPETMNALVDKLYDILGEFEDDDEIEFDQWTTTDRSNLTHNKEPVFEYIELVCRKLEKLAPHSYLAKSQALYLRSRKEDMNEVTALFLGDFSENYKFVVQDEVQSFHWTNLQCTLHPVIIYFKKEGILKHKSYCIISDDMIHDVNMVYKIIEVVCNDIKTILPQIINIEYFSDGCAGQYKNCKNMLNLCFHCEDFGFTAKWNFFATSHGKQPCDGIGGTVKRLATLASLQRDTGNHILSPQTMYKYCNENIEGINFIYISSEDLTLVRTTLKERLDTANTIPGTRSYHQFVPLGHQKVNYYFFNYTFYHILKYTHNFY